MGILQARILEWVSVPSSRGSSRSRDQTQVSLIAHTVKNPPTMQETPVRFLGQEDLFEKGKADAAKSLQSCPTLCDHIDGSPPASTVPGILQARTLEWVAISLSNASK